MDRLHSLDASFLYLEDASAPMHIGSLCVFEGPAPSRDDLKRLYLGRIAQFPRYRQRVRTMPLELGRPIWFDDPHFDLDYHVRATAVPQPGDAQTLCTLMGRLMSQQLDRERPLWECWIVEGLSDGRWALIAKVHHAMVDGVSGTSLMTALLDVQPQTQIDPEVPWVPRDQPSRTALLGSSLRGLGGETLGWMRNLLRELKDPMQAGRNARDLTVGIARMARSLRAAPDVSLHGPVGLHRSYAFTGAPMGELQGIRQAFGGTLNDVVLAIFAGAYRALLLHHGDDVTQPIHTLVPVSVRSAARSSALDNQVAALICELPVHLADPVARLAYVAARMTQLKASHIADASAFLVRAADLAPPFVVGPVTRLTTRLAHRFPQRAFSTVTTHVPGPREALYLLGRKLVGYYPYVPLGQGTRIGAAVLTYDGQVNFGISADPEHVPDLSLFIRALGADVAALARCAHAHPTAEVTSR